MRITGVISVLALSALLTMPARSRAMTPDAQQDMLAWRIAETACHQQQPGEAKITQPAQLRTLRKPASLGGMATLFYCLREIGALRFATAGAAIHDPLSESVLGELYLNGWPGGVAADPAKSFAYFMRSARQGLPFGSFAAGLDLVQGSGAARNPPAGAALIRRAAVQGLPAAMRVMGALYLHGVGVPRNQQLAAAWIKRAAAAGDQQSRQWLAAQHAPPAESAPLLSPASPAGQPSAQSEPVGASTPVDQQQKVQQLQQFWTLYFKASHARVVDFGAPALVEPVGFGGRP